MPSPREMWGRRRKARLRGGHQSGRRKAWRGDSVSKREDRGSRGDRSRAVPSATRPRQAVALEPRAPPGGHIWLQRWRRPRRTGFQGEQELGRQGDRLPDTPRCPRGDLPTPRNPDPARRPSKRPAGGRSPPRRRRGVLAPPSSSARPLTTPLPCQAPPLAPALPPPFDPPPAHRQAPPQSRLLPSAPPSVPCASTAARNWRGTATARAGVLGRDFRRRWRASSGRAPGWSGRPPGHEGEPRGGRPG